MQLMELLRKLWRLLDTAAAAEVFHQLYEQDRRCFSCEVDVRPCAAQWVRAYIATPLWQG